MADEKIPEITVGAESWHFKWYSLWLDYHPWKAFIREDFCHYVRVLLFWAPITWFFRGPKGRDKSKWFNFTPFGTTLIVAALMLLGLALYFTPLLVLIIALVVAVIAGGLSVIYFLTETDTGQNLVERAGQFLSPVGKVLGHVLGFAIHPIHSWFFTKSKLTVVRWLGLVAVLLLCSYVFLGSEFTFELLKVVATAAAVFLVSATIVILLALIVLGIDGLAHRGYNLISNRQKAQPTQTQMQPKIKTTSTLRMIWEYLKMKKHQYLCPYIILPNQRR